MPPSRLRGSDNSVIVVGMFHNIAMDQWAIRAERRAIRAERMAHECAAKAKAASEVKYEIAWNDLASRFFRLSRNIYRTLNVTYDRWWRMMKMTPTT